MVGRTEEKKLLQSLLKEDESQFVAVFGRRRVGKTFLIRESFDYKFTFQHTGISTDSIIKSARKKTQLEEFSKSLAEAGFKPNKDLSTWYEAFDCLKEIIKKSKEKKKVIFIDELSWMDTKGSELISAVESFWKGWINVNIIAMTCMCVDVFDDTGEIRPGGEALNFAAIASKYNHISVDLLGAIGDDDYGKAILKSIENKPINKEFIHIISGSATANHRIYLTEKGDRYFKDDSWNGGIHDTYLLSDSDKNRIASADIIFITFDSPNFDDVLELRKSCRFQLAVDFNVLRDFKKIETIVPYINFFFISGEKSILLQFQKWSERYDNIFNITLAENGSVTYYMGKEYRVDAVPVNNVIDTTGCGDSYHAGFLCSYLRDCDIINAMNEGSRVASKTLSHIGGF